LARLCLQLLRCFSLFLLPAIKKKKGTEFRLTRPDAFCLLTSAIYFVRPESICNFSPAAACAAASRAVSTRNGEHET